MKKIFSWDCETNGLLGKAFAIGAVVYNELGEEIKKFYARCLITGVIDSWVAEHVLPQIEEMEITHSSYEEMLEAFAKFFKENKEDAHVIFHMGNPLEGRVIIDMHDLGYLGEFEGAFPWLDIAGCLLQAGYDPVSVLQYNEDHNLVVTQNEFGGPHNPLYDSRAAAICFMDLQKRINAQSSVWTQRM